MNPTCEVCGREMVKDLSNTWHCAPSSREHELCAKLAESEAKVRELEAKLWRRGIMEDRAFVRGVETGFSLGLEKDRKGYTQTLEAYSRGIHEALEEARKKGAEHGE